MLIARSVHPLPGEAERKERLLGLIDGFSSRRVLIVGDLIADEFIYGEVARVSREAPVLILKYDATEILAGGAGNAANNVASLGGRAIVAGIVALNLALTAAALALAPVMTPVHAALCLAGVALAVAIGAAAVAWRKHVAEPLDRTRRTVREDVQWAKETLA